MMIPQLWTVWDELVRKQKEKRERPARAKSGADNVYMLNDDDIRSLVARRSEGSNLDYKAGFAWTKENREKKYELVRGLMAMSNTKDGGRGDLRCG